MKHLSLTTVTNPVPVPVKVGIVSNWHTYIAKVFNFLVRGLNGLFSWHNIACFLNCLPLGICECKSIHDAKMYMKVLFIFFAFIIIVNLVEKLPL